jgi:hypothetical protein
MAKVVEAGLIGEQAQTAFDEPALTQTSSRTNVEGRASAKSTHEVDGVATEKDALSRHGSNDPEKTSVAGPALAANEATLLHGFRLYAVFGAMMLGVFMFALDQSVSSGSHRTAFV